MRTIFLAIISASLTQALPLLTIPNAATFNLTPNTTFNLPFSITADADNYVVINSVTGVVTRSPGEIYGITDVLSVFVSNFAYALAPGNAIWTESLTPLLAGESAGSAGQFLFPANVTPGGATGNLFIAYELYNLNPFEAANAVQTGNGVLTATYTVNFAPGAEVPEPHTVVLAAAGLAAMRLLISKRQTRDAS